MRKFGAALENRGATRMVFAGFGGVKLRGNFRIQLTIGPEIYKQTQLNPSVFKEVSHGNF